MLSSKHQPLHVFVPAGFNGPISNYTDYLLSEVFLNIHGKDLLSGMLLLGDRSLLEYTLIFFF